MAMQYLGVPYVWGGNGPFAFDCSGLVLKSLSDVGILLTDRTSQGLYEWALKYDDAVSADPCEDCLLFFGKSADKITHIAIALDDKVMIEAGGGDSTFTKFNKKKWSSKDARVRIKPIARRSDLIDSIKIHY